MEHSSIVDGLDPFTRQYLETALWSSGDEDTECFNWEYDIESFHTTAIEKAIKVCRDFQEAQQIILEQVYLNFGYDAGDAGHDFWLTRNHHGVGFWDRGLGELGEILTLAAESYREISVVVGDDGALYLE